MPFLDEKMYRVQIAYSYRFGYLHVNGINYMSILTYHMKKIKEVEFATKPTSVNLNICFLMDEMKNNTCTWKESKFWKIESVFVNALRPHEIVVKTGGKYLLIGNPLDYYSLHDVTFLYEK